MGSHEWSRRDLLKSLGTGTLGLGVGAAVYRWLDHYIVGTRSADGAAAAASVSDSGTSRIDLTEHTSLKLVRGVFSRDRLESLRSRDDVTFVHPDHTLRRVSTSTSTSTRADGTGQTLPWGVDRIDADIAHAEGTTGAGVDVGVIDHGIANGHTDLAGNLADPTDESNHESWVDCQECDQPWGDDLGHGTHVAGTIAAADGDDGVLGVAPDATLHALKVCGGAGGCRASAIVEAIRYAADQGWDVINLSLGSRRASPALQAAGQYALEAGVLPVAAAGNYGRPDSVSYPAAYDEFVAVTATDIDDELTGFSSTGPEVDIAAPGADICSTVVDGYAVQSGTSMAAPHVTGATATLLADGYTPTDARERLLETAEDLGMADTDQGAGLVDVAAAHGYESDGGTVERSRCPS
ncbi:S8 family peptidase [Halobiforma nitratireducens]|uniref:Subtilisin-like serine protease n=1 Tax=Halobiforma nitratireducens JCM 10879 TaxID=1227454 RepID=M0LZZ1_9EURY|nr:S8 family peptidase [Halobiforma nitratireducens]EMA39122.1 subtilisin-like serine protease [Halobiforma nitratireducens JCM 10879]